MGKKLEMMMGVALAAMGIGMDGCLTVSPVNEPSAPVEILKVTGVVSGLTEIVSQASNAISPQVSPDGRLVSFAMDSEPLTSASSNWDIGVVNAFGGELVKVTEDKEMIWEQNPCWTPDNKVVYDSDYPDSFNIWMKARDGSGGASKLTSETPNAFRPTVSPDGALIAYTVGGFAYDWSFLSSYNASPGQLDRSMNAWYYQGANRAPQIWLFEIATGSRTLLTEGLHPAFCPDGKRLAFTKLAGDRLEIWSINLDGSRLSPLIATGGHDMEACWSPSGRAMAFVSGKSGHWKLWAVSFESGFPTQITAGETDEGHPSWGPGGSLYFHSNAGFDNKYKIWKAKISL